MIVYVLTICNNTGLVSTPLVFKHIAEARDCMNDLYDSYQEVILSNMNKVSTKDNNSFRFEYIDSKTEQRLFIKAKIDVVTTE